MEKDRRCKCGRLKMRKNDTLYPACQRCWTAYIEDDDLRALENDMRDILAVAKVGALRAPTRGRNSPGAMPNYLEIQAHRSIVRKS